MMSKAVAKHSVDVGTVVAGTYQIAGILGRGGMGSVWEATHLRLPGKRVAIKVLHANIADDAESLARFRREAEIACRLGHPNIVEVHDFNHLEDGSPYLILELLEGQALDRKLLGGPLDIASCERIARQIASALQCAHEQGVIHRDLKPQNIFLVPSATGEGPDSVKVLDFGISKIRGSQTIKTQDSTLLGTPQYMAPEQAIGNHDKVDARTDLFALAAMLYELLTGQPAFGGQSIPEVVYKVVHVDPQPLGELLPGLDPSKAAAIHKALSKAQEDRFPDLASFVLAFTGTPLPSRPQTRNSNGAALASAPTLDSNKIDLGQAATFDSRSQAMATVQAPADVASGIAETIDSSKIDKLRASIQVTGADVESIDVRSQPEATTKGAGGKTRTYVVTMVLVCGVAALALFVTQAKTTSQDGATIQARESAAGEGVGRGDVQVAEVASGEQELSADPAKPENAQVEALLQAKLNTGTSEEGGLPSASNPVRDTEASNTSVADTSSVADTTEAEEARDSEAGSKDQGRKVPADQQKRVRVPDRDSGRVTKEDDETAIPEEALKLLEQAEAALKAGKAEDAVRDARRAYRLHKTDRSLIIQAKAKCLLGHLGHVQAAMRKLPARKRAQIRAFCTESGFPLH